MKNAFVFTLVIALVVLVALPASGADKKFVGTKTCKMCHNTEKQGKQFDIWQKSKHAEAFKALKSPAADKVAKERGSKLPAAETPECLACHVTGHGVDAKLLDKGFVAEEGVQCEACHGAGSEYKAMGVMKDKAKAIAAGMTEYKDEAAIEKHCKTCHNEKSPTYKEFKFKEMLAKIAHPTPKK
jgi:hypothetical protein